MVNRAGDTARVEDNAFRIEGRTSVDIIKSGGYKISALDVEYHLLCHERVRDVAVLGLADETYGQLIAAVVVLTCDNDSSPSLSESDLRRYSEECMAKYQVPRVWRIVEEIPRNAMGKVNKKELIKTLFNQGS